MEKHLCIVMDRHTKEQIGEEMVIEAADWYYARHQAANKFRKEHPCETRDWVVDSLLLDQ